MVLKELCLLIIIGLCLVNGFPRSKEENVEGDITAVDVPDHDRLLHRSKRGWGALIFTGLSILVRTTSLGLTLGAALSDGCIYYKSICSDKDEIERLDNLIKGAVNQYETEYAVAKKTYYDLKTATTNNGYISYYINHTMQIVETLQDIEDQLTAQLEMKLPALSTIVSNQTFEQYLNIVMGQLEYTLSDIQQNLATQKQTALIGIAVQYVLEAAVARFAKSFQNAYNQVSNEDIIATASRTLWDRMEGNEIDVKDSTGKWHKLKLVPKTFKQMAKNFGQSFVDFGKGVKKWGNIKSWKGFKGKLAHTFSKPLAKLSAIKQFIVNPKVRTKFAQNYKMTWSQGIMTGIGIVGDAIQQFITAKEWGKVAEQMKEAREDYQLYYDNLQSNLTEIRKEKEQTGPMWDETIEIFKNLSIPFKTLIINASEHMNFSDVVGLSKLPIDRTSPLFTIDYDQVTKDQLPSNQLAVIGFLKEVDNNMTVVEDNMRARVVLYTNTMTKSEDNEVVKEIKSDISDILTFSPSATMKNVGSQLTVKDIVCTVSVLRIELSEYDYYSLNTFRPRCEVNDTAFQSMESDALLKRKSSIMREVVSRKVTSDTTESLTILVDAVHNAYTGVTDPEVKSFGTSVTDQDVVCVISEEFPSKQSYDYIDLTAFRPSCSAVTQSTFSQMVSNANKLREIAGSIQSSLTSCNSYFFCPCLSQVASTNGITEAEVETILKQLDPNWAPHASPQFCGPTGCGCKHL